MEKIDTPFTQGDPQKNYFSGVAEGGRNLFFLCVMMYYVLAKMSKSTI